MTSFDYALDNWHEPDPDDPSTCEHKWRTVSTEEADDGTVFARCRCRWCGEENVFEQ